MTKHAYDSKAKCVACGERCLLSTPAGLREGLAAARAEIEEAKKVLRPNDRKAERYLEDLRVEALEIASRLEWQ
jgi:hypothetical protein